jgi:hypothetical protein
VKTYLVFIIQGYDNITDTGTLTNSCEFQLIAEDLDSALKRAKQIVEKPNYRLSIVVEKYV